nr:MAG TPA: hypothetical protein [Caudoviricetes sp.]
MHHKCSLSFHLLQHIHLLLYNLHHLRFLKLH